MHWRSVFNTDDDMRAVNHFRSVFKQAGLDEARINDILNSVAQQPEVLGDPQRAAEWFADYRGRHGISDEVGAQIEGTYYDAIIEGVPMQPFTKAEQDELAHLSELQKDASRHGTYWRSPELQERHLELTLRAKGAAPSAPTAPAEPAARVARKTEIELLMKEDPRAYFRSEGIQAEYRSILDAESPAPAGDVSGDGASAGAVAAPQP